MSEQPNENTCVVCFKNVLYYSIGECDHPVCFECSTRMRVLCLQNECPICRQHLSRVVFTESVQPYKELRNRVFTDRLFERQFKIGFCNEEIKQAYERLLENRCNICDKAPPFRHFSMLSDHMRKVHEKYYCDLCVKHLKIFISERKCYTRQELAHHRRKGDIDDTSHRGHPLCEFCEERFMDADELYRHLRKEHLYCHLCDADGKNLYYPSHSALAHHFRTEHYLCEEGECAGQHLTAVFRSEIDLKAHKATVHGRGMNRGAARQARTLELQFNITPHPVVQRTPRERERAERAERAPSPAPAADIDTRSDAHFPRLSAAPPHPVLTPAPHRAYQGASNLARTDKNFPALAGDAGPSRPPQPAHTVAATILRNSKPGVSIQVHSQPGSASNFRLTQTSGNRISIPTPRRGRDRDRDDDDDDFPALGPASKDDHPSLGAAAPQPPKVALINSQEMQALKGSQSSPAARKGPLSSEAFPALGGAGGAAGGGAGAAPAPAQWITVKRDKPRRSEPRAAPAPAPAFTGTASDDFPTLPANKNKKKHAAPAPAPPPAPAPAPADPRPNKKDKKKKNREPALNGVALHNGLDNKYARDFCFEESEPLEREPDRKIKTVEATPDGAKNNGNGDFKLATDDYPPLTPRGPQTDPPRSARPDAEPASGKAATKGSRAAVELTFTNSSGQTFPAAPHAYIPPPDFERRNRALVEQLAAALPAAELDDFKVASRAFRHGDMSAGELHARCGARLAALLPELVALLPDVRKQQELALGRGLALAVCDVCGQLLAPRDAPLHRQQHSRLPPPRT